MCTGCKHRYERIVNGGNVKLMDNPLVVIIIFSMNTYKRKHTHTRARSFGRSGSRSSDRRGAIIVSLCMALGEWCLLTGRRQWNEGKIIEYGKLYWFATAKMLLLLLLLVAVGGAAAVILLSFSLSAFLTHSLIRCAITLSHRLNGTSAGDMEYVVIDNECEIESKSKCQQREWMSADVCKRVSSCVRACAINPIQQMTFDYCCGSNSADRTFAY